jgi:hypothetical protein
MDGSSEVDPRWRDGVALGNSRAVFAAPEGATWSDSDQWENLFTATEHRARGGAEKAGAIS